MKNILIVDDSLDIQASLKFLLEDEGYHCLSVLTPSAAFDSVKRDNIDLVLLDMNFSQDTTSGKEGIDAIEQLQRIDPLLPIIVMTGWATLELAVDALRKGAADFIEKPWDDERLAHSIKLQLEKRTDKQHLQKLTAVNERLNNSYKSDEIAYSSAKKSMLKQLNQLAKSDMNILLTGENGTGKSHYAHIVHQLSARSSQSFVSLNMGAISDELFASELFGHKKGAFTDAKSDRVGVITLADGGTLFLDEIANVSLASQAKLLHVLEERKYTAIGSHKVLQNNARIISATNQNLEQAIDNSTFRQDLYYRLNTVEVEVPPLRECADDILPLAELFLSQFADKYQKAHITLSNDAKSALLAYDFPGNIRELKHIIERVIFTCENNCITASDLVLAPKKSKANDILESSVNTESEDMSLSLDELIESALMRRLQYFNGNATQAAKSLGMSRSAWYRKMAKYE